MALGELSSMHPAAGSFGVYADLYLNQWAGFVSRAGYWAAICLSVGASLVASAIYMRYWFPSVPALFWVALFSLLLGLVNLRSVHEYGRFEYWFSMVKLATMLAFIAIGGTLLLSGHVAPQYTAHGGFFPNGRVASLLALTFALYTFGGVEIVAITTGESRSAAEVPRAVLYTFAHSYGGLSGRGDRVGGSHAMGPCRRLGESVCHGVSHGQDSCGKCGDELRHFDGSFVMRERKSVCGIAHAVFAGAGSMGSGQSWDN